MWRSNNCAGGKCKRYRPFPLSHGQFYIDGLGHELNDSAFYSGHEYYQVIIFCPETLEVRIFTEHDCESC